MNLDQNDFALIEQALRERINQGSDYQKAMAYQGVLNKLQGAEASTITQTGQAAPIETMAQNGITYDYDDNT